MLIKWVCNERLIKWRGLMHPLVDVNRQAMTGSTTESSRACSSSAHPGLLFLCRFRATPHPEGEEV